MSRRPEGPLRTGFTTGACATAATTASYAALLTGAWPDPVTIRLPKGQTPSFALAEKRLGEGWAEAAVVKDAGDDPDVTHGALIRARVRLLRADEGEGEGVRFAAGEGVGMVTRPGLPLPPGEPAINPVPRAMMAEAIAGLAAAHGAPGDVEITVSVPGGARLAEKTWNPRLGIEGGVSILGTTGIVKPFSCSAWIASIHRGIDVARAGGAAHAAACTGSTSERAVVARYGLPDWALLDMGDFAGGLLKYLARHPLPRLTLAGGFAKITKLAQGALDLHSGRSQVDFEALARVAAECGADPERIRGCNTAAEALQIAGPALAGKIAGAAHARAAEVLGDAPVALEVMVVDRKGAIVAQTGFAS